MDSLKLDDLSRMLLKGSTRVIENKEKINAINIFPVPDSDTGTNFTSTLLGVQNLLKTEIFTSADDLVHAILDTAFSSSQGNSGIMMVSYLKGCLTFLKDMNHVSLGAFAHAMGNGAANARKSVEHPVSGTMLDVMDAFAHSLNEESKKNDVRIEEAFYVSLQQTKAALKGTEKKMKLLESNHVVDAGALGFTFFVYGMYEGLTGKKEELTGIDSEPIHNKTAISVGKFPFEVVFIVSSSPFSHEQLKVMFEELGDSLDIVTVEDKVKIHIHTNIPDVVRETAMLTGDIKKLHVVDMRTATVAHGYE